MTGRMTTASGSDRHREMSGGRAIVHLLDDAAPKITGDEARLLACRFFASRVTVRPLAGERDHNFHVSDGDGAEYVLKVMHPADDPAIVDFQIAALSHIAAVDPCLCVPRVVHSVSGNKDVVWTGADAAVRRVKCLTYLPGQPLDATRSTADQRRNVGAFLARLDLALADFRHPADDRDLLWDLKRADQVFGLLTEIADVERRGAAQRALERFAAHVIPVLPKLRCQVIHNDFNPANVLAGRDAPDAIVGVIDFGDLVRAPLVQDLATACAYQIGARGHPLAGPADIASAFHAVCPLRPEEIGILPDLIATRLALIVTISSWRAARHPDAAYIVRNQEAACTGLRRLEELSRQSMIDWLLARLGDE